MVSEDDKVGDSDRERERELGESGLSVFGGAG